MLLGVILKGLAAAAASVVVAILTAGPAPAATVPPLTCTASVSNTRPQDYTTEHVYVATRGNRPAQVTTTAYYRTSRPVRYTTDPRPGTVSYWISDATPGYRVTVQVVVRSGRQSGYCTTSFTPQYARTQVPPPIAHPAPPGGDVTVTNALSFTAAEPTDLYAHVTTTGLAGAVVMSENIYCGGILQESGDLPSTTGGYTTPLEFAVTPVLEGGQGCTVDLSAVTTGQDMGIVYLTTTYGP